MKAVGNHKNGYKIIENLTSVTHVDEHQVTGSNGNGQRSERE